MELQYGDKIKIAEQFQLWKSQAGLCLSCFRWFPFDMTGKYMHTPNTCPRCLKELDEPLDEAITTILFIEIFCKESSLLV